MRINIFEAGLVTYLMAGKGFLPQDEPAPRHGAGQKDQPSAKQPAPPARERQEEPPRRAML